MKRSSQKTVAALLALLLCGALAGCSLLEKLPFFGGEAGEDAEDLEELEEDPEYPVTLGGATLGVRPGRVVSLAPSLTEKLFDLGLDDRLAGVSDYCDYPAETDRLARCGTAILPDLEMIRELGPHLVLTQTPLAEDVLIALQQMNTEVAVIPYSASLEELYQAYEDLCVLLEGRTTGEAMGESFVQKFRRRLETISAAVAFQMDEPKPAVYLRQLDNVMATGDTVENQLMEMAGLRNVAAGQVGWEFTATEMQLVEVRADFEALAVIFCPEEDVSIRMLEQNEYYKSLPAVLQDRYLYIDAVAFERQSLRMIDELEEMALYCYPNANLTGSPGSVAAAGDTGAEAAEDGEDDATDDAPEPEEDGAA